MDESSEKRRRIQFDSILILILVILVIAAVTLMILEWPKLLPLSASLRSRLEADYSSRSLMETIGVLRLQIIEDIFRDMGLPVDMSLIPDEELVPTVTPTEAEDTATPTPSPTLEFTATNTNTPTATRTPTRTLTPTLTPTRTWTPIPPPPTRTRTRRPPTVTYTPSITLTPSNTPTATNTPTPSITPTFTSTFTPTASLTPTITPTPTPADSSAPRFGEVVFVLTKTGADQCRISVEYANAYDIAISYGIGPNGIGDRNGFVKLLCNIDGGGEACNQNLSGNDNGYVPYGDWDAVYTGSSTIGPIDETTQIVYRARVRDNAGKTRDTEAFTNIGCQD